LKVFARALDGVRRDSGIRVFSPEILLVKHEIEGVIPATQGN
jgi:hypothetical protein